MNAFLYAASLLDIRTELSRLAASSGGWLSRLWKRGDSTSPGPVKANLGEQSAFYYDKELKRWVNKNVRDFNSICIDIRSRELTHLQTPPEANKPPATAPPPRAQTVSPAASAPRVPPGRPATAIDLTDGPPRKPPMRVRSNLVPSETAWPPPLHFPLLHTPPLRRLLAHHGQRLLPWIRLDWMVHQVPGRVQGHMRSEMLAVDTWMCFSKKVVRSYHHVLVIHAVHPLRS